MLLFFVKNIQGCRSGSSVFLSSAGELGYSVSKLKLSAIYFLVGISISIEA